MEHDLSYFSDQQLLEFFKLITANVHDVVGITDEQGLIKYRSQNCERLFGVSADQLVGRNVFESIHPDDQAPIRQAIQELIQGPQGHQIIKTARYRHNDGHYIQLEVTGMNLLEHPLIKGILITYHDETAHQALIQKLETENERYHALIESTGHMAWSVNATDFGLETYNGYMVRYYQKVLGITLKPGLTPKEMLPPERVAWWMSLYREVLKTGQKQVEYPMATADRILILTLNPIIQHDQIIGISVFTSDETSLRTAKRIAEMESAKYQTLIDNMSDFVFLIDGIDYRNLHFNKASADFIKRSYHKNILIGMKAEDYLTPKANQFWVEKYQECLEKGHLDFVLHSFGGDAVIHFMMQMIYLSDRHPAILVLGEDITAEDRYRHELEQAKETLILTNRKLHDELEKTFMTLSKTIEVRDPYTAGHQRRVQVLCEAIAKRLNLDERQTSNLRFGALVHDIGKIYVPTDLLNKPGKLTTLEFTLIQTHAQYGYDILTEIGCDPDIPRMVLEHHERIDGSGYPNHLKADEILLESRILGIADTVEAMVSHRPYRASLGVNKALEEIRNQRGKHYDAHLVDLVVTLFEQDHFEFPDSGF